MEILKTGDLRKWAKDRGYQDSWWFAVDGGESVGPASLSEIPREGQIVLMNTDSCGQPGEEWFVYRYPGFKTLEEREKKVRKKPEATEKQKVALEYFGHTGNVDRATASELLDGFFQTGYNYGGYQEHVFANLHRLHSGRELYEKAVEMLQTKFFHIKENVSKARIAAIVDQAEVEQIPYQQLVAFIEKHSPACLLAESTSAKKRSEYEAYNLNKADYRRQLSKEDQAPKKGCGGAFMTILTFSFVVAAAGLWLAFAGFR